MPRILIVEDHPDSARLAARLLRRAGCAVEIAPDAETGLKVCLSDPPEIALIDLGLPDLDGQTMIAILRQQTALKRFIVLAFTAWPADTARQMAQAYGCDGVVTKPIDTRAFAGQVLSYLEQKTP
ncbi:MAG: response regulator [Anaerolinea sp.]|nr:response regulator [Anaerolinea sp.]